MNITYSVIYQDIKDQTVGYFEQPVQGVQSPLLTYPKPITVDVYKDRSTLVIMSPLFENFHWDDHIQKQTIFTFSLSPEIAGGIILAKSPKAALASSNQNGEACGQMYPSEPSLTVLLGSVSGLLGALHHRVPKSRAV